MNAYTTREELTLLPADRITYPEHYADARSTQRRIGLFSRIVAYFERQRVISELNSLSDRELVDIGLTRSEVPMVFQSAYAKHR